MEAGKFGGRRKIVHLEGLHYAQEKELQEGFGRQAFDHSGENHRENSREDSLAYRSRRGLRYRSGDNDNDEVCLERFAGTSAPTCEEVGKTRQTGAKETSESSKESRAQAR